MKFSCTLSKSSKTNSCRPPVQANFLHAIQTLPFHQVLRVHRCTRNVFQQHCRGNLSELKSHDSVTYRQRTAIVKKIYGKCPCRIRQDPDAGLYITPIVPCGEHNDPLSIPQTLKPIHLARRSLMNCTCRFQSVEKRGQARERRKLRTRIEVAREDAIAAFAVQRGQTDRAQIVPDIVDAAVRPGEQNLLPDAGGRAILAGCRARKRRLV